MLFNVNCIKLKFSCNNAIPLLNMSVFRTIDLHEYICINIGTINKLSFYFKSDEKTVSILNAAVELHMYLRHTDKL